jgi:hypothetical protein
MRRLLIAVIVAALVVGLVAPVAHARHSTAANVALGLAAFAVFNQIVSPILHPRVHTHTYVVEAVPVVSARPIFHYPPPAVYPVPAQPVVVAPPPPQQSVIVTPPSPPALQTVVQYPHGRHELRGDGIKEPYVWVWIPSPPPPPPPAPPPQ